MKKYIGLIVIVISVVTILSGVVQLIAPAFVLKNVGIAATPVTDQLFATIAMFMILFGGVVIHGVYSAQKSSAIILWAAFQKLGAAIAVGIGIYHGIFNHMSGAVASFDFCSGILFLYYFKQLKANEIY
jgi:hypothetical protein